MHYAGLKCLFLNGVILGKAVPPESGRIRFPVRHCNAWRAMCRTFALPGVRGKCLGDGMGGKTPVLCCHRKAVWRFRRGGAEIQGRKQKAP